MTKQEEELYIFTIYSIIDKLKDKIKFKVNQIDYDNLELIIEKSNIEGFDDNDFSISFQKQNGSFTLIIKKDINENKKKKIIDLFTQVTSTNLFASYRFIDMQDIDINHFVYDDDKLDFNSNILKQFESMQQITDLSINKDKNFSLK